MIKTYTFKIKPNKNKEKIFEEYLNTTRYVYNLGKEVREESYKKGVKINYFDLSKQLTEAKKEFSWLKNVNSQTLQATLERLENTYKKFFKGAGYPKWAKKKNWKSIDFKSIKTTFNAFKLPSIGVVKVFKFKVPKGELKTAKIVKEADGWYLKVVVKEEDSVKRENQSICAIDVGVSYFLTTSHGEFVDNPKHLFNYLKQLRIENRKLSRMRKGGSNFKKQVKK
jgi:putative transposase